MWFPFYIAKRYLLARKSQNVINIITLISIIGIAVGTAGLVVILSVFNGFGNLVLSLYDTFDADIKITAVKGKSFDPVLADVAGLRKLEGINSVNEVLEENVLLKYRDRQVIARIKGVDSTYEKSAELSSSIIDGAFILNNGDTNYAIIGSGVAYYLSMDLQHLFSPIQLFVPRAGLHNNLNTEDAFNRDWIIPSGVFAIQQDFDNKYIFVPLSFARKLLDTDTNVTSLEVMLKPGANPNLVKQQILKRCGNLVDVKTRIEQHDFLYKILFSEKFVAYFVLCLILLIATFNILGSLTMLIIEKKHDIGLLLSLGADVSLVKKIFLTEGLLITCIGSVSGIAIGYTVCFAQMTFGLIKIENSDSFIIDAYPVAMMWTDFLLSFLIVSLIGAIASYYTSQKLVSKYAL